jgi:tetratricopeptide (TPR) repeat protein
VNNEINEPQKFARLEAEMELAFREGDIGTTALLAWEAITLFPDRSSVARIYIKKLLRDPNVQGITIEAFVQNAKELRKSGEAEELAQLSALGLLRFPAHRYLSLSMMDASQNLHRPEWIGPLVEALGEPAADDVVLLNARASMENKFGNYEKANSLFKKLMVLEPKNEVILQNYSASLVGLERYEEAAKLLEQFLSKSDEPRKHLQKLVPIYRLMGFDIRQKLTELDERFFTSCGSRNRARVHADLRLFLQDISGVEDGLRRMQEFEWVAGDAFELAEAELAQNKLQSGLERYGVRFEAFPYLEWCKPSAPLYSGQILDKETLFLWGEQGLGDEIMFSMFFERLSSRVKHVIAAIDSRLMSVFQHRYPHWKFLDRHDMPHNLPQSDFSCPMGQLMVLFLPEMLATNQHISQPIFDPDPQRYQQIADLLKNKTKPRVAISWRGGAHVNGLIRSMTLAELMESFPSDCDVSLISLQYDDNAEQDVIEYGDRRVELSGLDNRGDLEGVFALLRCCDAVVTVDNAVAHFGAALGIPTAVLLPASQIQFRWRNPAMKNLLFPGAELFVQEKPSDWSVPVKAAWQMVSDLTEKGKGETA